MGNRLTYTTVAQGEGVLVGARWNSHQRSGSRMLT